MKIGIFGGTFDPVHLGHVGIGSQAIKELNLDKLILVPARLQPFKLDGEVASGEHRVEMIKLAFENINNIEISRFELERDQLSYTINTLSAFRNKYKNDEIWFLLGADSLLKIHLWKDAENLLKGFNFVVGVRPGYKEEELEKKILEIKSIYNTNIYKLSNEKLCISSTEIKNRISQKLSLNGLVTPEVERYIYKNALYK